MTDRWSIPTWIFVILLLATLVATGLFGARLVSAQGGSNQDSWTALGTSFSFVVRGIMTHFLDVVAPQSTGNCLYDMGTWNAKRAPVNYQFSGILPAAGNTNTTCRSLQRWSSARNALASTLRFYVDEAAEVVLYTSNSPQNADMTCAIYTDSLRRAPGDNSSWAAGNLVAEDDDSGGSGHCRIETSLAVGYYVLELAGRNANDAGKNYQTNIELTKSVTGLDPPSAVTNLTATVALNVVTLTWAIPDDGDNTATSWQVRYRSRLSDNSDWNPFVIQPITVTAATWSHTFPTNAVGTLHQFEVVSLNTDATGPAAYTTATPLAVPPTPTPAPNAAPPAVTGLTATVMGQVVTLNWAAATTGRNRAASFNVRYRKGSGSWTTWESLTATTWTVADLDASSAYTFAVTATNSFSTSSAETVTVTTEAAPVLAPNANPSAVTNLAAVPDVNEVTLTWDVPDDGRNTATSFTIVYVRVGELTYSSPETVLTPTVTISGLTRNTAYSFQVRGVNSFGQSAPGIIAATTKAPVVVGPTPSPTPPGTPAPTPLAHQVRLVTTVSAAVDAGDFTRLRINIAEAQWTGVKRIEFICNFSESGTHSVSDADDAVNYADLPNPKVDVRMAKVKGQGHGLLDGTELIVASRIIQNARCVAKLYDDRYSGVGRDTNAIELRWQTPGRTLFHKEQAFQGTPGGSATWLFLPAVFFGVVIAAVTRNAGGTLMAVSVAFGVSVWFTEAPPIMWVVVVATAASGVIIMLQLGFRGR